MIQLELWQKVVLYMSLLASLYIYVKTSQIKINSIPLLRKKYRILVSVFFPLILLAALIIGSVILAVVLVAALLLISYSFITKKKISLKIGRIAPKKPLG